MASRRSPDPARRALKGDVRYYLETDGQIFLVRRGATWTFPRLRSQLPCEMTPLWVIPVGRERVVFAKPHLDRHPVEWFHKDEVIGRRDVDPLVQQAVNRTLVRTAAKVAIIEEGRVLMVKAARGITKGFWNLPGGFMGYGEHPEESARREVREETGLQVLLVRLIGIYREVFTRTGGYMLSFVYEGRRTGGRLRPHPEEMEAVEWMPVRDAIRRTRNPFARAGLRDLAQKRKQGVGTLTR